MVVGYSLAARIGYRLRRTRSREIPSYSEQPPRNGWPRRTFPRKEFDHDDSNSGVSHGENRRPGHLLPRGGSKGRLDDPALARLPDFLAYVPHPDPSPG